MLPAGKSTLAVLAMALAIAAFAVNGGGSAHAQFIRGDANGDAQHNIADAIHILNYLAGGGPSPGCLDAADVNDSGTINIVAAIQLFHFFFVGFSPPDAPFPSCGDDTTMDALDCIQNTPGCP